MAIYRGAGGARDATSDAASEALLIRELAAEVVIDAAAAEAAKVAAEAAKVAAQLAETNAETAETNAETAETNAETAQAAAASSATAAASSASAASTSATNAATSATSASGSASAASTSATNAASSASAASTSATNAASSASSASTSATSATNSATSASTSAATATTQATNASNSATAAAGSATSASGSASTATTQAGIATTKATEAAASAAAALTSETNAASSASAASTSASNAATSASNASTSASNAATSASAADASAVSAAASAASAAASYDNFDDRYLGAKSSDPSVDNDGNALVTGALYYNTVDGVMKVFDGGVWIAASAASQAILTVFQYTATSGQTTFTGTDNNSLTLGYTVGSALVTLNGVVLEVGSEVTATSGTSIVLASAATAGDEVNIYAFATFELADVYTKSASDARYPLKPTGAADGTKFLRDDNSWQAIASNAVSQSIPLKSGATATAGKALSINPSGEVGEYPTFNTIGTSRTGVVYTLQSRDGTRAITATVTTSTQTSTTWTITGYVISGSANAVTGTTATFTITNPNGDGDNYATLYVLWSGDKDFVIVGRKYSRYLSTEHYTKIESALVTVDSSGNVTKGTNYVVYSSSISGGSDAQPNFVTGYVKDNVYAIASNEGNSGTRTIFKTITQSGGSFTGATDAEVESIAGYLNQQSVAYTTNNIIVCPSGASVLTASYTTNNIGTVTTTTVITDNADSNIYWTKLNNTYLVAAYKKSDASTILRAFSINQTTGALTSISTYTLYSSGNFVNFQFAFKDENSAVFTYKNSTTNIFYINTISLVSSTLGVGNVLPLVSSGSNIPLRYTNTTDVFMVFNEGVNFTYTVLSYLSSGLFSFAGFVNTTTSTSPASVVVAGIASGFTGLTPSEEYYLTSSYDGTLTIDGAQTGIRVGVALSSSTLLIRT